MSVTNVTLTGDWERLYRTLHYLNTQQRIYAVQLLHEQSQKVSEKLEEHIVSQDLGWGAKPESSGENHTGLWWDDTDELYNNLSNITYTGLNSAGGKVSAFIGFKGDHSGNPPIANNAIAEMNESVHPLVAPTWKELEGEFKQQWDEFIAKSVRGGV